MENHKLEELEEYLYDYKIDEYHYIQWCINYFKELQIAGIKIKNGSRTLAIRDLMKIRNNIL